MSEFHWRDEHLFMVHATIEQHGFFIQYVMGEGYSPSWGYTIGFLAHGHPEVVVLGLNMDSAAGALHLLHREILAGEHRPVGRRHRRDLGLAGPACLVPVPAEHWSESGHRLCIAVEYYAALGWDPDRLAALQLVWTEPSGCFPWDRECPPRFRHLQPILELGDPMAA
jgi:hypothetical protein